MGITISSSLDRSDEDEGLVLIIETPCKETRAITTITITNPIR